MNLARTCPKRRLTRRLEIESTKYEKNETITKELKKTMMIGVLLTGVFSVLAGCTSYYKVTDPGTGTSYYTTDIKKRSSGAIELTDKKTNKQVTLQNSEIEKLSEEKFQIGVYSR